MLFSRGLFAIAWSNSNRCRVCSNIQLAKHLQTCNWPHCADGTAGRDLGPDPHPSASATASLPAFHCCVQQHNTSGIFLNLVNHWVLWTHIFWLKWLMEDHWSSGRTKFEVVFLRATSGNSVVPQSQTAYGYGRRGHTAVTSLRWAIWGWHPLPVLQSSVLVLLLPCVPQVSWLVGWHWIASTRCTIRWPSWWQTMARRREMPPWRFMSQSPTSTTTAHSSLSVSRGRNFISRFVKQPCDEFVMPWLFVLSAILW